MSVITCVENNKFIEDERVWISVIYHRRIKRVYRLTSYCYLLLLRLVFLCTLVFQPVLFDCHLHRNMSQGKEKKRAIKKNI